MLNEQNRHEEALKLCEANADRAGDYRHGRATALTNQAVALIYLRRWKRADLICRQGLELQKKGSRPHTYSLINAGIVATELDRLNEAAQRFLGALKQSRAMNEDRVVANVLGEVGALLC